MIIETYSEYIIYTVYAYAGHVKINKYYGCSPAVDIFICGDIM